MSSHFMIRLILLMLELTTHGILELQSTLQPLNLENADAY